MSLTALLTEDEYLNLPEFVGRQEFRDGELIELSPPKYAHSELVMRIHSLLRGAVDESRILIEAGFRLRPRRWVIPDICVTWEEQPRSNGYIQGAPMLAIEVASRGNTPDELQEKVKDYLESGVGEVCVIYPKTRTMMVYRPSSTALFIEASNDYFCELIGATFSPEYRTPVE